MATRTISNAGGNWSSTAAWVEGVVPTSADDVVATATSGNLSHDAATQACRSIDFTGYTGTFTFVSGQGALLVGDASGGDIKLVSGMTISYLATGGGWKLVSTLAGTVALTTAGKNVGALTVQLGSSTTLQLQDNITDTTTTAIQLITHTSGNLDTNSKTITTGGLIGTGTYTRTLGSSTINCSNGANNSTWQAGATCTFATNTATLNFTNATSTTINPGVLNYNGTTFKFSGGGTCSVGGGGTTTVGGITVNSSSAITLVFPSSSAWALGNLTVTGGSAGTHHAIKAATAGTHTGLVMNSGTTSISYCDFTDVGITGTSAPIDATNNCVDNGNNSGVKFTTPYIAQTQSTTQATSSTATPVFPDNTVTGNTIVVASWNAANTISTITDSQSNTYHQIDTGASPHTELWYAYNITGGTTPTVTITYNGTAANRVVGLYEIGSVSTADPLDQHVLAAGSSTAAASGNTSTTTVANEMVVTYVGSASANTPAVGAGYSNLLVRVDFGMAAKAVTSTGAQSGSFTVGNAAWECGVATFKASVASTAPISPNLLMMGIG